MGKGQGVVDATFKLICMAVYAAYILIGMGVCIIAVLYWSSTAVASGVVSGLLLLSGFVMIGVGSAAIYGIHKDHALVLSVVWICDVVLFCMFVLLSMVGLMVGLDVRDPARTSTDNAWGVYTGTELESQREWRKVFWSGAYCTSSKVFGGRKQSCDAVFKYHATHALLDQSGNFSEGTQIGDVFADCKLAQTGLPCTRSTHADDVAACAAQAHSQAACEAASTPASSTGCEYTGGTCVPAQSCESSETLRQACEDCNQKCKEDLIADTKENLEPAAFVVFVVLGFCLVAALINDAMVDAADFSGATGLMGLIFNGAVAFSGLVLTIAAGVGQYMLSQDCQGRESCTNIAVNVVIVMGLALVVLGVLGVFGVQKNRNGGGLPARLALRKVNIVLICCAFVLSIAGILLSLAGGGMESVNGASEKNFEELRGQMEAQDPDYCLENNRPMSDTDCRAKIAKELEENVLVVGGVSLCVAFGLFVVIVLTFRTIKQLKSSPSEDLETMDNPTSTKDDDELPGSGDSESFEAETE